MVSKKLLQGLNKLDSINLTLISDVDQDQPRYAGLVLPLYDPDQDGQNYVGPDRDPNCLTLCVHLVLQKRERVALFDCLPDAL